MIDTIQMLVDHIRTHGPIPTVRVSSAQAIGRAKSYAYWGAVRYEIRLTRDGQPANIALERAGSDRRSARLAKQDADKLAAREGREPCQRIGRLSREDAAIVLIGRADDQIAELMAQVRGMPRWMERAAAGAIHVPYWWMTDDERSEYRQWLHASHIEGCASVVLHGDEDDQATPRRLTP